MSEIVWKKRNFGMGKFPRPQHEILLVCRRGGLPFRLNNIGSVQEWAQTYPAANVTAPSRKRAIDLIEQASPGPYVELFARRHRLGWDVWGDESANTASLEVAG